MRRPWLDPHQDRPAVEEDRVETSDQDQGLGRVVQPLEDGPGGRAGGWDPPMNSRATRSGRGAQEDGQQDPDWVEAQAHGQGRHSELLLLGQRELDGLEQPIPELEVLPAEGGVLFDQFLSAGSAAVLGLDGGQDLLGMIGDALAAATGLLGLRGDGTVVPEEARGGMGDPADDGYGTHGDRASWGCVRSTTAPMRSIPRKIKRLLVEPCQVST